MPARLEGQTLHEQGIYQEGSTSLTPIPAHLHTAVIKAAFGSFSCLSIILHHAMALPWHDITLA